MVDGIHKDADILHHRDAMPPRGRFVEQLLNVQVGGPGVHLPLGDGDEGLAAAVLGQAQHRPGVTLREAVVQHELPLVLRQL